MCHSNLQHMQEEEGEAGEEQTDNTAGVCRRGKEVKRFATITAASKEWITT